MEQIGKSHPPVADSQPPPPTKLSYATPSPPEPRRGQFFNSVMTAIATIVTLFFSLAVVSAFRTSTPVGGDLFWLMLAFGFLVMTLRVRRRQMIDDTKRRGT